MGDREKMSLEQFLVREGLLTQEQADLVKAEVDEGSGRTFEALLPEKGLLTEKKIAWAKAYINDVGFCDVDEAAFDEQLLQLITGDVAARYCCLPLQYDVDDEGSRLLVMVTDDPDDHEASEALRTATGYHVRFIMSARSAILRKIKELYKMEESKEASREIPITDIESIYIGQTENAKAGTGCTVFISEKGMPAGLDVRGGGPASRESELLKPLSAAGFVHGIVLAGGSAFGLGCANGVMQYLEEKGIGFDTGFALVPLVAQSDLYDLSVGDAGVRPDAKMGYEAARLAMEDGNYKDGNFGAGCGATVGKIGGMDTCMKTGIGSYALQVGELKVGAVVALNALGDVYDHRTGKKLAGFLTEDKKGFRDTVEFMAQSIAVKENKFTGNTTLGVVITNAAFTKPQLCKIAGMAHDGFARSIRPVHTSADGDSIYAVSTGNVQADQDLVGILAADVMSEAIKRAVFGAESAYGFVSAKELGFKD